MKRCQKLRLLLTLERKGLQNESVADAPTSFQLQNVMSSTFWRRLRQWLRLA